MVLKGSLNASEAKVDVKELLERSATFTESQISRIQKYLIDFLKTDTRYLASKNVAGLLERDSEFAGVQDQVVELFQGFANDVWGLHYLAAKIRFQFKGFELEYNTPEDLDEY